MVTDKQDPPSRTPTQEIVIAEDAAAATTVTAPLIEEPRPRPNVQAATLHAFPYGDDAWTELEFEGEHVEVLNVAYGSPKKYPTAYHAAMELGAALHTWGQHLVMVKLTVEEHDEPKPCPKTGNLAETAGSIGDDGIEIDFGGACPVQGDGTVDGHPCYYRSRGTGWQFAIWEQGVTQEQIDGPEAAAPIWEYSDDPYAFPDGGWIAASESIDNIRHAVAEFRLRRQTGPEP